MVWPICFLSGMQTGVYPHQHQPKNTNEEKLADTGWSGRRGLYRKKSTNNLYLPTDPRDVLWEYKEMHTVQELRSNTTTEVSFSQNRKVYYTPLVRPLVFHTHPRTLKADSKFQYICSTPPKVLCHRLLSFLPKEGRLVLIVLASGWGSCRDRIILMILRVHAPHIIIAIEFLPIQCVLQSSTSRSTNNTGNELVYGLPKRLIMLLLLRT